MTPIHNVSIMSNKTSDVDLADHGPHDDYDGYELLAERLLSAWISYRQGVGVDYAYRKHVRGKRIGEFWKRLAKQVDHDASNAVAATLFSRLPGGNAEGDA